MFSFWQAATQQLQEAPMRFIAVGFASAPDLRAGD